MKAKPVLVIIDMQTAYDSDIEDDEIDINVIKLIEKFKEKQFPIFNVTIKDSGNTVKNVLKSLRGYKNIHHISKRECDGSKEVKKIIDKYKLYNSTLYFCGVYSFDCVAKTANGISRISPDNEIFIVKKAVDKIKKLKKEYLKSIKILTIKPENLILGD